MRTDLLAPRPEILLERQTSEIELGEVRFDTVPRPLWLPRKVVVTAVWQHLFYRNEHRYSDYKIFSVETREDKKEIVRRPGEMR
jgi:tryptophan-rich sensory protein